LLSLRAQRGNPEGQLSAVSDQRSATKLDYRPGWHQAEQRGKQERVPLTAAD
jgi:hypothetical protein